MLSVVLEPIEAFQCHQGTKFRAKFRASMRVPVPGLARTFSFIPLLSAHQTHRPTGNLNRSAQVPQLS